MLFWCTLHPPHGAQGSAETRSGGAREGGEKHILGGENLTLKQILDLLAEVYGKPQVNRRTPHWVAQSWSYVDVAMASLIPGRTPMATPDKVRLSRGHEFFDPGKAIQELGLPQTPARKALRKAVAWYRQYGYAP